MLSDGGFNVIRGSSPCCAFPLSLTKSCLVEGMDWALGAAVERLPGARPSTRFSSSTLLQGTAAYWIYARDGLYRTDCSTRCISGWHCAPPSALLC
jgi:hypothetical protein